MAEILVHPSNFAAFKVPRDNRILLLYRPLNHQHKLVRV